MKDDFADALASVYDAPPEPPPATPAVLPSGAFIGWQRPLHGVWTACTAGQTWEEASWALLHAPWPLDSSYAPWPLDSSYRETVVLEHGQHPDRRRKLK